MLRRIYQATVLSLFLSGCGTSPAPPAVVQSPIEFADEFADRQDASITAAAGYIAQAKTVNKTIEQTDKVKTVGVLLDVASSYLDSPTEADLARAKKLSEGHSDAEVAALKAQGEKAKKDIDAAWEAVVKDAERKRVEAEQNLKRAQMELEQSAKREEASRLGMVGAGLIALGALCLVFGGRIGISAMGSLGLIAAGAFTATLPRFWDSPYFVWVSTGLALIAGGEILVYVGRRLFSKPKTSVVVDTDDTTHQ